MIDKETAIALARQEDATPYTNRHYPDRPFFTCSPEQLEAICNLAIKHTQKDAEPIGEVQLIQTGVHDEAQVRFHMYGSIPAIGTKLYDRPANEYIPEAIQLLSDVFDAWENGTQCNEEDGNYIGTAFRLDDAVFDRCCTLLNRVNPPRNSRQPNDTALLREALEGYESMYGRKPERIEKQSPPCAKDWERKYDLPTTTI